MADRVKILLPGRPALLSAKEIAWELSMKVDTVRRKMNAGIFGPVIDVAGMKRIATQDLEKYLSTKYQVQSAKYKVESEKRERARV